MTTNAQPGPTPQPGQPYTPTDQFGLAAQAQAQGSQQAINQQTVANRSNQTAADGSTLTWTQDPTTGQWTQKIAYAPGSAGATFQQGADQLGQQAVAGMSQPIDTSNFTGLFSLNGMQPGQFSQGAQDAIMGQYQPLLDRQREQTEAQLANQGITRGSEAWRNAEDDLARGENDARLKAITAGFAQGNTEFGQGMQLASGTQAQRAGQLGEQQTLRMDPLQSALAFESGAKAPQFGQYTTAGSAQAPNYLGAAQSQYNAGLDKLNLSADQRASLMNGLFSLGGSAINSPIGQSAINWGIDKGGDFLGGLFGFGP